MADEQTTGCGCGCFSLIISLLALYALAFGLPTTWGTLHVDFFPPGVYLKQEVK